MYISFIAPARPLGIWAIAVDGHLLRPTVPLPATMPTFPLPDPTPLYNPRHTAQK